MGGWYVNSSRWLKTFAAAMLVFSLMGMGDLQSLNRHGGKGRVEAVKKVDLSGFPMVFEENKGQIHPSVKAFARSAGYSVYLLPREAVLALNRDVPTKPEKAHSIQNGQRVRKARIKTDVVRMKLLGAREPQSVEFLGKQPGVSNYFGGSDASKWRKNVAHYGKVGMMGVYPGIDVVYYGDGRSLEYDFVVNPGANPKKIALIFEGAKAVRVRGGKLVMSTGHRVMEFKAPVAYQKKWGCKVGVESWYMVEKNGRVGFGVGDYDPSYPLVIDPVLVYSTYLGKNASDCGYGVAVDTAGYAYVSGFTYGTFPATSGAYQTVNGGSTDLFVAKVSANGASLVYSTYLGGALVDSYYGYNNIAVDTAGCAYVVGYTTGSFPTTSGACQTVYGGNTDVVVAKLSANGASLVYSTYLGGSSADQSCGIAVDTAGCAYVVGYTTGSFPTTSGAYQTSHGTASTYAFVTKLASGGSSLVYSSYLGGTDISYGRAIAVDTAGCAYVAGQANGNFPTTSGACQTVYGGNNDAFVAKMSANGASLVYSTYLGGATSDTSYAIAVDAAGCAFVTGQTSGSFPTTSGAYQTVKAGSAGYADVFVAKLASGGSSLVYSTYLGGSKDDISYGIAVNTAGCAYVTGYTTGTFPTTSDAYQTASGGSSDAFLTKLSADGAALVYSTYYGGTGIDRAYGIALDTAGYVYVTGQTDGAFPTSSGAYQTAFGGMNDAFVFKMIPPTPTMTPTITMTGTPTDTSTRTWTPTLTSTSTSTSTDTVTETSTDTPTTTSTETSTATSTDTATSTSTETLTWTSTVTDTPTPTWSSTTTATATSTDTLSDTETSTKTSTWTPTATDTPTLTSTSTSTPTSTDTAMDTSTDTPTTTSTSTETMTWTPTVTNTPTSTWSSTTTATATSTDTLMDTATSTETSTWTPTATDTPTLTSTSTSTSTSTDTVTETSMDTPTTTSTETSTATFTDTATNTSTETLTWTPTSTSTSTSTSTDTVTETSTDIPTSTWTNTHTNTETLTCTGTSTPTDTATITDTATNTLTPTVTQTQTSTWTGTMTSTSTVISTTTPTVTDTPITALTETPTVSPVNTPASTSIYSGKNLVIFPNPAHGGYVQIVLPSYGAAGNIRVRLFTLAARKVLDKVFYNIPSGRSVNMTLMEAGGSPLANGLYCVWVNTPGGNYHTLVMVLR